ncbi:hypothetical protein SSX86_022938 [Deinandra increscens subsp. villosa]|uniref:Reverse transcriptase Ty1/copia-type domain-containing protein n=1 Tax=Deinandra increscens subsp. villosa TaxID=3103831 RepID=A0AAP0CPA9_9ASTR
MSTFLESFPSPPIPKFDFNPPAPSKISSIPTPCPACLPHEPTYPIPHLTTPMPSPLSSPSSSSPSSPSTPSSPSSTISSPHEPSPTPVPHLSQPPVAPSHPMITRAKAGIFKPKHQADLAYVNSHPFYYSLFSQQVPKGFKSAAKNPLWMRAMEEEMSALRCNGTWTLVPRPNNVNIVGSKWIFRTKYLPDGTVDKHKARLVAQGFTQIPGLDFTHTFSPVVKAATIRIVLSLAVINNCPLHQLDVKNAFLNGNLGETIFMEQPPGFLDDRFPHYVCKLNKALYGLKQAPRAWFQRLSTFLLQNGFTCSKSDTSLFIFKKGSCIMYLLVYVDDLILTGSHSNTIRSFIFRLHKEFATKDMGNLSYFMGLEATHDSHGLFLSQSKYAHDIVAKANLLEAKPFHTPLATSTILTKDGTPFSNPTMYRFLVGALQYLTITRPDISFAVNQVSQFLQNPTEEHFQSVKRILRYVKGTLSFGLHFSKPKNTNILGYSDADWARCIETCRSTYGYSILLAGTLSLGVLRSNLQLPALAVNLNIVPWLTLLLK